MVFCLGFNPTPEMSVSWKKTWTTVPWQYNAHLKDSVAHMLVVCILFSLYSFTNCHVLKCDGQYRYRNLVAYAMSWVSGSKFCNLTWASMESSTPAGSDLRIHSDHRYHCLKTPTHGHDTWLHSSHQVIVQLLSWRWCSNPYEAGEVKSGRPSWPPGGSWDSSS